jgi:hypothetical protein
MMNPYVVRVTGPGIDWQMMITDEQDLEALDAITKRIRKHIDAVNKAIESMTGQLQIVPGPVKPCQGQPTDESGRPAFNNPDIYPVKIEGCNHHWTLTGRCAVVDGGCRMCGQKVETTAQQREVAK